MMDGVNRCDYSPSQGKIMSLHTNAISEVERVISSLMDLFIVLYCIFNSVDKLTEVAHQHIETSTRIQSELVLEGTEFYIDGDIKVFPDPVPPPRPPSVETTTSGTLTISQLSTLHKQFLQVAPKGKIMLALYFCKSKLVVLLRISNCYKY